MPRHWRLAAARTAHRPYECAYGRDAAVAVPDNSQNTCTFQISIFASIECGIGNAPSPNPDRRGTATRPCMFPYPACAAWFPLHEHPCMLNLNLIQIWRSGTGILSTLRIAHACMQPDLHTGTGSCGGHEQRGAAAGGLANMQVPYDFTCITTVMPRARPDNSQPHYECAVESCGALPPHLEYGRAPLHLVHAH